jgi:hypothetical protein
LTGLKVSVNFSGVLRGKNVSVNFSGVLRGKITFLTREKIYVIMKTISESDFINRRSYGKGVGIRKY